MHSSATPQFPIRHRRRKPSICIWLVAVALASCLAVPAQGAAQTPWDVDAYRDGALLGAGVTGTLAFRGYNNYLSRPGWNWPLPGDSSIRGVFRGGGHDDRQTAIWWSDVLLRAMLVAPHVVDTTIGVARYGSEGLELSLINAQWQSLSLFAVEAGKTLVRRGRPNASLCKVDDPGEDCTASGRDESFPSGHAAAAFTSASLMCLHHIEGDLLQNRAADIAVCSVSLAVATTTGLLRVVADKHYFTDVLTGAAIGIVAGFVLPRLIHYDDNDPLIAAARSGQRAPMMLQLGGDF